MLSNVKRYMQNGIYTLTGNILLAMNPFERLPIYDEPYMGRFPSKRLSANEPHVFASAEEPPAGSARSASRSRWW